MKSFYKILSLFFALVMAVSCLMSCEEMNINLNISTGAPSATTTSVTSGDNTTAPEATTTSGKNNEAAVTTSGTNNEGAQTTATTAQTNPEDMEDPGANTPPADDPANQSKLPLMDWQGTEVIILGQENKNFEIATDELPDDVIGRSVYQRNDSLANKYNFIVVSELSQNPFERLELCCNVGEDWYDSVVLSLTDAAKASLQGYLLDLTSTDYINLEHPSWNQAANEQLTVSGSLYFSTSDFLLTDKEYTHLLYYNKSMSQELGLGDLEDMVENNTWTYDNFNTMVTNFSNDSNGDGLVGGKDDRFGIASASMRSYSAFLYGAGFLLTKNNEGILSMNGPTSELSAILEKSAPSILNTKATYYPENFRSEFEGNIFGTEIDVFLNQNSLFLSSYLQKIATISSEADFEISYMPYPKYSQSQENYYTLVDNNSCVVGIPYVVFDSVRSGYMLQAITEESTETSYAGYFENYCKLRHSQSPKAAAMLDIIFENPVYDIAYIHNIGGLFGYLANDLPNSKDYRQFETKYAIISRTAEDQLAQIMKAYAAS